MAPMWPDWWSWELEFTPHVERRMEDRNFTEIDLRAMPHRAVGYHRDVEDGRYVVVTRFRRAAWEVVVEPDVDTRLLVVVTAYPVDKA